MNYKDLAGRLNALKKTPPVQRKRVDISAKMISAGWTQESEFVFSKETVYKCILPEAISNILAGDLSGSIDTSRLVFYDTETTGLSGGAGNIIFLAGFGQITADRKNFAVRQFFLSDFPGEHDFLLSLSQYINPAQIYVSYNGRSFDANVLKTRFTMNGMSLSMGYQMDLLYPARRLWKSLIGSCSLGDIERSILNKTRELDVPGSMVPDLYFNFLKNGQLNQIEGVFAHHKEDIVSLAELVAVMEEIFVQGSEAETHHIHNVKMYDKRGLAMLLQDKYPERSEQVLLNSFTNGNIQSGIQLSLCYKRKEHWKQAEQIWLDIWNRNKSIFCAVELAKYYEHKLSRPDKALELTEASLGLERFRLAGYYEDLKHRKKRLTDKISRKENPSC